MGNHSGGTQRGAYAARAKARASGTRTTAEPAASEGMHERSARLQREGGLAKEVTPSDKAAHGLTPVWHDENARIDVSKPMDPAFFAKVYGEAQLGAALSPLSRESLNQGARSIGVTPGRTNAETVSRITSHLTQGRYSANFGAATSVKAGGVAKGTRGTKGVTTQSHPSPATHSRSLTPVPMSHEDQVAWSGNRQGMRINVGAAMNPYMIHAIYGTGQLREALSGYSLAKLREGAQVVAARIRAMEQKPPRLTGSSRAILTDRIIQAVASYPSTPFHAGMSEGVMADSNAF